MISKSHLDSSHILKKIQDSNNNNWIQYFIWENFIDSDLYLQVEKEIQNQNYTKVDIHSSHHRNNKTVVLEWKALGKIFNFFESPVFEKYLSIFTWKSVRQEFYVDRWEINSILWKDDFCWAIAQIYEKWDFFDWHVDGPISEWSLWAFTYYLGWYSWDWDETQGWNLDLWNKWQTGHISSYKTIPYKKNTLVLILASPDAYHRVSKLTTNALRLSIQSTIMKKN